MTPRRRKAKVRRPALVALATALSGVAVTVAANPALVLTRAGLIGLAATVIGGFAAALAEPLTRSEHERNMP